MGADFSGVRAKLRRGDHHLCALRSDVMKWMEGKSYGFLTSNPQEDDPECKRRLVHFKLAQPVPVERWGVALGDVLFCYRSALDHAVYALATHFSGQDPPPTAELAAFPICNSKAAWSNKGVQKRISDLSLRARTIVQDHQPYLREKHTKEGVSRLRALRALNDWDKHRLLHVAALIPEEWNIQQTSGPQIVHVVSSSGTAEDKAPVFEIFFADPPRGEDVQMDITMTIGIGIENPDRPGRFYRLVGDALVIRSAVKNVIGDLERVTK